MIKNAIIAVLAVALIVTVSALAIEEHKTNQKIHDQRARIEHCEDINQSYMEQTWHLNQELMKEKGKG